MTITATPTKFKTTVKATSVAKDILLNQIHNVAIDADGQTHSCVMNVSILIRNYTLVNITVDGQVLSKWCSGTIAVPDDVEVDLSGTLSLTQVFDSIECLKNLDQAVADLVARFAQG
jgi:hypothetical protein